jgi:diguanylate cyclase (GGDEF)-like protein
MHSEQTCPIPDNEARRLGALRAYEILDTPQEVEFDALTRVASHAFSAPIAVVAMMDSDRLWFKSRLGLDIPELDRKIAFCAHAIMRPHEPLVVPDLREDERFAANPLVVQPPHVRFYAGAPIVDSAGHALGTIAVIDAQPRSFTNAQRDVLGDLASLAITALDGRRRAIDLKRLALTDHLTGIPNRAHFDTAIEVEVAQANRSGVACTVISMDLDGFKDINDSYGHAAGDEFLVEVARRLSEQVRKGDTLARLGGDEFAIVMRQGDEGDARVLMERVGQAVREPVVLSDGNTVSVGVSMGVAHYTPSIVTGAELLALADRSLYAAKGRIIPRRTLSRGAG